MNQRIAELYDLAIQVEDNGDYVTGELDPVKFAELIIRECADIAKHHVMNISTYADAEFVEEQIEKHFAQPLTQEQLDNIKKYGSAPWNDF